MATPLVNIQPAWLNKESLPNVRAKKPAMVVNPLKRIGINIFVRASSIANSLSNFPLPSIYL